MRGSPLIRTLIVLIALLLAGFGLGVLGKKRPSPEQAVTPEVLAEPIAKDTPFVFTLSAPATKVFIESLGQTYSFNPSSQTISGTLPL